MPISIRFGVISIFLIKYEYIHILFFIKQFLFEFLSKNTIAINNRQQKNNKNQAN
jgi:hypothetical protein